MSALERKKAAKLEARRKKCILYETAKKVVYSAGTKQVSAMVSRPMACPHSDFTYDLWEVVVFNSDNSTCRASCYLPKEEALALARNWAIEFGAIL